MTRKRFRRMGCGALLVLWFTLLIIVPCGIFNLLLSPTNEIILVRSAMPDDQIRIWLINGADNRGIGFANGYVTKLDGGQVCTQTDLRFLLWRGSPPDKSKNCTCYQKVGEQYSATSMDDGTCMAGK